MKTLLFDAPPEHALHEGDHEIRGGETFTVDDARAEELLTQPGLSIREAPEQVDFAALKRPELDQLARDAGLDPTSFPNRDAVIAALNDPATADSGAGDLDPDPQED